MRRIFARLLIAIGLVFAVLGFAAPAMAIPVIYNPGHVRVEKVAALPDEAAFRAPDGHLDLGWAYKEYSLYGMPLGYGRADGFVFYNDRGYYNAKPGALPALKLMTGHDYAADYHFNPIAHLWGWLILLPIIGLGIHGKLKGRGFAQGLAMPAPAQEGAVPDDPDDYAGARAAIDRAVAQRAAAAMPVPTPGSPSPGVRGFGRKGT